MGLLALSDLHVDFAANMELVAALPAGAHAGDTLLLAGDLSHRLDRAEAALMVLAAAFGRVYFTPGNHDLWVDDGIPLPPGVEPETSLNRMAALDALCAGLGVRTEPGPSLDGDSWILPLRGWYGPAFHERLHGGTPEGRLHRRWADHKRCRWPEGWGDDGARTAHLCAVNEAHLAAAAAQARRVVTISHFLPRPELLPPLQVLRFKELPRVSGSERLEAQLRAAGATAHVFGHTHIPWDETIDGVRYVQNPLAYPYERARRGEVGMRLVEI